MHIYICVGDYQNTFIYKRHTAELIYKYVDTRKKKNSFLSLTSIVLLSSVISSDENYLSKFVYFIDIDYSISINYGREIYFDILFDIYLFVLVLSIIKCEYTTFFSSLSIFCCCM